jgi:hypothetical protein
MSETNWKDTLYKLFWTVLAAAVAAVPVATADWPAWTIPIIAGIANWLSSVIRQQTGETPPDASHA